MSKILAATCVTGVVTCEGVVVNVAEVLSKGVGSSSGLLFLQGDKAYFIPSSATDIEATLTQVIAALGQVKTALDKTVSALTHAATASTAIDGKPTGGSGSAVTPVGTSEITGIGTDTALITTAATAIDSAKSALTTLKGQLK